MLGTSILWVISELKETNSNSTEFLLQAVILTKLYIDIKK